MILRELFKNTDKNLVVDEIIKGYFADEKEKEKIRKNYVDAYDLISDIPYKKEKRFEKITIQYDKNSYVYDRDGNTEKNEDINQFINYECFVVGTKTGEKTEEQIDMTFIDWENLIELPIENRTKNLSEKDCAVIILVTLTFWGFDKKLVKENQKEFCKLIKQRKRV